MFHFYLFRCKDGSLYSGVTNDLKSREKRHNAGQGAIYTRTHGGGKMVYAENFRSLKKAMRREAEVKKWPKTKKENLINSKTLNT